MIDVKISDGFMRDIVGTKGIFNYGHLACRCACKTKLDLNEDALKRFF